METWSDIKLRRLFNRYIRRLKYRKLFLDQIECLLARHSAVIEQAVKMRIETSRLAFLPVFPRPLLDSPMQAIAVMENGLKRGTRMTGGYTFVMPELVTDISEIPDVPYFIFDIEDGLSTLGTSPDEAQKKFKDEGHRGLTDMEIVALGMHGDVLLQANLYAASSYYGRDRGIDLRMEDGAHPVLCHNACNLDWQHWAVPSCDAGSIIRCIQD